MTRRIAQVLTTALLLGSIVAIAEAMTANAEQTIVPVLTHAAPIRAVAVLERRLAWSEHHINRLNNRNAYLHRYIRDLRSEVRSPVPTETTSTTIPDEPSTPSYPAASSGCLSGEQVASYARAAGFPESVIPTMVSIADRESGLCPGAINSSSGACGLWQIYPCPGPDALDPARNAALAYSKYESSGLSPWAM